ncbi:ATP-binding protein [Pseudomonas sp. MAFF212428]|uniref:ATP-binding protein n=1 Tax=Pseudomonas brassicae TaxID=2708063 RepID=A0A6M0CZ48_9PSED|nr:ATP-binding protein [Pseudomonas brassicae]
MLTRLELENFGPLQSLQWNALSNVNLVIGPNSCGKTFILKALYSVVRSLETHQRGHEPRSLAEILYEKLYWTFQADKIGDLVTKGAKSPLSCTVAFGEQALQFGFGKDTAKTITAPVGDLQSLPSNSIFLPPKEVLSLQSIILKSRELDNEFGFDDTYYDLAKALSLTTTRGNNYREFASARSDLEEMLGGKVEFDSASKRWQFKKGNQKYPIGATAEGIKKIAILDTLLGNRYLALGSIIFIDEPESALHPTAISKLIQIIVMLSQRGIQFFIASHSYFVIKALYIEARRQGVSLPVLSSIDGRWKADNMQLGMPDNPIVDESIRLYEEEVELALE